MADRDALSERSAAGTPWVRQRYLDSLRVLGMLLVFVIHAAEPFNPWDSWHVESGQRSKWLGELILLLAPWVMPLFMLVAGASAALSLQRRTVREYLHERVSRIVVPLAVGILTLVPPQVYLERRQRGEFDGSFVEFYPHFFDGIYPAGNFTWLHLWFLAALAASALVTLPLFGWLRGASGRRLLAQLATWCQRPGALLWLVLPLLAFRAVLGLLLPGRATLADWSNRTLLLPFFIYGFTIAAEPRLAAAVDRQWTLALIPALAFSGAMALYAWPGNILARLPAPSSRGYLVLWTSYTLGAWCWVLVVVGVARRSLSRRSRSVEYAGRLVTAFYVLHQTVIVVVAYQLVNRGLSALSEFTVVALLSFAVTATLCEVIRRSRLLRPAFGLKR